MEQPQDLRQYFFRHRHQISLVLSAFLLGLVVGGSLYWYAKRENLLKQEEIGRIAADKNELLRKLAAADVESRILRSSQANLKKTLEEREATIAEHEASLEFYRQLMVVDNKKEGLDLNTYVVTPGDMPGSHHFRFAFVQYAKQHVVIRVKVNIRLEGVEGGRMAVYYLRDLLPMANPAFGQLEFKYFQVIEGDMQLPAGFEPRQIVVDAELQQNNQGWQRKLPWHVEES